MRSKKIEVRVPVPLTKYQDFIGSTNLQLKEIVCGTIIVLIFILVYVCGEFIFHVSYIPRMILTLLLCLPFGIYGFIPLRGLTALDYAKLFFRFITEPREYGKHSMPTKEEFEAVYKNQHRAELARSEEIEE